MTDARATANSKLASTLGKAVADALCPVATDRTDRYTARLDKHLAGLPAAERGTFLVREFDRWARRYAEWAADVDDGWHGPSADGPTAHDYVLTIAEIQKRIDRLPAPVPA